MIYTPDIKNVSGAKSNGFSFNKRLKSFSYALEGIISFFAGGVHARIHLLAAIVVVIAGFYFRISGMEMIAIGFSIALVWITEMINTAIEKCMDMITLEKHPQVKVIKDIAAGAVLIAAMAAIIVGAVVFIPKIFLL
ncbi:MAG TPA: diacylglycerol kinase family protein [Flavisolibacter sp.]